MEIEPVACDQVHSQPDQGVFSVICTDLYMMEVEHRVSLECLTFLELFGKGGMKII